MKKIACLFLILSTSIILWKCASQTTPTGGPKDIKPPTLKNSTPSDNQTNFRGRAIELTFDELLQLNNPKEEIIITPTPGKEVNYTLKQNRVLIEPKAGWLDSTTYSITFREGIKDLNEGNSVENLHLAFSTGPTIDSLQISGKILESLKDKIPENITVALYQEDTFDIFKHSPSFFAKTKADGSFKIENLKEGKYFIYAFDDKNKNLRVESKNEKYGFLPESIQPIYSTTKKNSDTLSIAVYQIDSRPLKISSIRNTGTITQIRLNKEIITYKIINPQKAKINHSFGPNQSEILIYNELEINDSIPLTIQGSDSLDLKMDSTFFIKRTESKLPKEKFSLNILSASINPETLQVEVKAKFSKPIEQINFDSIYFTPDPVPERAKKIKTSDRSADLFKKEILKPEKSQRRRDSLTENERKDTTSVKKITKVQVYPKEIEIDSIKKLLTVSTKISKTLVTEKVKQINLALEQSFIVTIEKDSSKREIKSIPIVDTETTGMLHIEVITKFQNYEIWLLSTNGDLIQKVRNVRKYTFRFLAAQEYKLMFYADLNNNGSWDSHNIYERKAQEPSFFYKTQDGKFTFPIRSAWELGPLTLKF